MTRLGPHFDSREFRSRDGAGVPPAAMGELRDLVVVYLEPLRDRFGAVTVTSGYRTARVNLQVRGAARSFHRYDLLGRRGVAADVVCSRGTPDEWADFLDRLGPGGLGRYRNFVHVDNRREHARWRG
jgi:uncharacterized protein YcbK (DUF882 family)